ncbi:prostaglandin reductase 1-like [Mizuhopecten yessoensis]|uniref:prostaglandin reductase 1-like n=1 Tax=Mizuhopecten yessoensis TaxID=6573 RepID=UPI000B4594A0|nr:prostaglandin reductase 1-like [Mizuhopecten yessoensis]
MVKSKVWTLKTAFDGKVRTSNFELIEEEVSDNLKDGEYLIEALHWTVDPYMRVFASKTSTHPVGSFVRVYAGWRTHTIISTDVAQRVGRMPELGDLPLSLTLGVMGMPGMAAYFGFLEICQPKEGDVILVNGAAGAVGSLVGQIAKIKGCKVVGCAGTDDKCKWLKELGFDEVFNYKKVDLSEALEAAAPDGFDCFFDNIGADFTATALKHMKQFGRVSICGQISSYNDKAPPTGEYPFMYILGKQLKIEGFVVMRWYQRWAEGEKAMAQWIREGKIKYKETIYDGFENMPKAFVGLFDGANTGKAIISA